ncbi:MAG: sulfotransferase family protein [Candidatus Heimdallarchaeaceae archaeon]
MFIAGASLYNWFKLLWQNRFKIHIKYIPKAIFLTFFIMIMAPLDLVERIIFWRKLKNVKITKPPIFILGHWRSGTTFLQEMLIQDPQFGYLTITECLFPNHFLLSYPLMRFIMKLMLPEKRPMDDMRLYTEFPAEHDWSLSNMCLMSPYTGTYFPQNRDKYIKYASFDEASERERKEWKRNLKLLLKKLTHKNKGKQLVLKSPLDTYRIKILLEVFPDAKFIHIHRNPYEVFFSTKKLYIKNEDIYVFQKQKRDLDEFVFNMYEQMYEIYERDVHLIPEENFYEISYEEFKEHPIETLKDIYKHFNIPNFDKAVPYMQRYLESRSDFKVGKYKITKKDKLRIYSRWHKTIHKWNYESPKTQ